MRVRVWVLLVACIAIASLFSFYLGRIAPVQQEEETIVGPIKKRIELYKHHLGEQELVGISEVFNGVVLGAGAVVDQFEKELGEFLKSGREDVNLHVVGVASCTTGLQLLLSGHGISQGDEVITTAMTYVATVNAIYHTGAIPILADADPTTGLVDINSVIDSVTPQTKAVMVVHLFGRMVDISELRRRLHAIGRDDILIFEDAAHSLDSVSVDGHRPGMNSNGAVFSFSPTKSITAGNGGAIATIATADVIAKIRRLRYQGIDKDVIIRLAGHVADSPHYDVTEAGYKSAMSNIEAAILRAQLPLVETRRKLRQERVEKYYELLGNRTQDGVELFSMDYCNSGMAVCGYHLFPIMVPYGVRDAVLVSLREKGIGVTVNYRAIQSLSFYAHLTMETPDSLPVAWNIGERIISLPLYSSLPFSDIEYVAEVVLMTIAEAQRSAKRSPPDTLKTPEIRASKPRERKLSTPTSSSKEKGRKVVDEDSEKNEISMPLIPSNTTRQLHIVTMLWNATKILDERLGLMIRSLIVNSDHEISPHMHFLCDTGTCRMIRQYMEDMLGSDWASANNNAHGNARKCANVLLRATYHDITVEKYYLQVPVDFKYYNPMHPDWKNPAIFASLFIHEQLPDSVHDIIFADTDVMFSGPIRQFLRPMAELEANKQAFIAVADDISIRATGLNNGISIWNLARARQMDLTGYFTDPEIIYGRHKKKMEDALKYADQTILSELQLIHPEFFIKLPLEYHLQAQFTNFHSKNGEIQKWYLPVAVHFAGSSVFTTETCIWCRGLAKVYLEIPLLHLRNKVLCNTLEGDPPKKQKKKA